MTWKREVGRVHVKWGIATGRRGEGWVCTGCSVRLRDMHLIEIEAFFTVRISVGCTVYVQMHLD